MATYIVKKGDTLSALAARYKITLAKLRALNPGIKNPNVISVGQRINVPGTTPTKPPAAPLVPAKAKAAIAKSLRVHHWPRGMCDNFCANMYGQEHSGYRSATAHWYATPAKYKHTSKVPPAGAIVLYTGGSEGRGHATVALGGGKERSIDMDAHGHYSPGDVNTVTRSQVLGWGTLKYAGWIDPYFNGKLIVKVS